MGVMLAPHHLMRTMHWMNIVAFIYDVFKTFRQRSVAISGVECDRIGAWNIDTYRSRRIGAAAVYLGVFAEALVFPLCLPAYLVGLE